MMNDDPKVYTFEGTVEAAAWPESQWVAILIPGLVGPAKHPVDTLFLMDVTGYAKVHEVILYTLNLNPEAYHC